ncbi:TlpA family protein disulfide reductase [Sedimenticola selenatireducens]|uniref:TlpA family protein disulfide reductase n=1 Tax=Sedimenticola selenatireducens TaxID=191960 RepID=A0A557SJY9_9GAMM|nr:TlpA disulfide reductase family protein [Sedimenticola selenatireducens]TVO77745.1 TlpA family protein disulfide reductase [Sedimenticola selenatireducens]TVT65050.1 MAG: TlpA family protein disulfide reductase [Sedimenticola selenatireducens]
MKLHILLICAFFSCSLLAKEMPSLEFSVAVSDQDINVIHYPASGKHLAIWFIPGLGKPDRIYDTALQLSRLGVEVWMVDLAESFFLPKGPSAMRAIDGKYVATLIDTAHKRTGKMVSLMGSSYSAIPVLRGIREWQAKQQSEGLSDNYLAGAVLFSPELYATIPALGLEPVFESIVDATNVPIVLYQAGKRGNRWQLDKLIARLEKGGANVYMKIMPGVTALYYDEDKTPATLDTLKQIPSQIVSSLNLLEKTTTPRVALPLSEIPSVSGSGLDSQLKPFKGEPTPPTINLTNSAGHPLSIQDYRNKVTVINFWASWCRPCVEEIPSLNNLRKQMENESFELISINYAEEVAQIQAFLQQVKVDFPVLLDPDGKESAKWHVLVFPSTFVIGPDGQIAYGLNGAIHWDAPDVVEQLRTLLPPSKEARLVD